MNIFKTCLKPSNLKLCYFNVHLLFYLETLKYNKHLYKVLITLIEEFLFKTVLHECVHDR